MFTTILTVAGLVLAALLLLFAILWVANQMSKSFLGWILWDDTLEVLLKCLGGVLVAIVDTISEATK